jgi:hypothetical protein
MHARTSSIDNHWRKSELPGLETDLSLASRPAASLDFSPTRKVIISLAGAAPRRTKPEGTAVRRSWRTIDAAEAATTIESTVSSLVKAMVVMHTRRDCAEDSRLLRAQAFKPFNGPSDLRLLLQYVQCIP